MRQLKYYVACSLDGYIAHADGSFDGFVTAGEAVTDYQRSLTAFDTVLMGRKTYEVGLREGKTNPYPTMASYVFSRSLAVSPDPQVTLIRNGVAPFIQRLKQTPGRDIYLCGGATLAADFLAHQWIDEIIVKLNPFLMGAGIPLFAGVISQTPLTLIDHQVYDSGVVKLRYRVAAVPSDRPASAPSQNC